MTAQNAESLCPEKLRRAFAPHCFDGTEVHGTIDHELRGLEHGVTAMNIKRAIELQYRNCIPVDVIVEIVSKPLEPEELA
jgi:hypothetical protein